MSATNKGRIPVDPNTVNGAVQAMKPDGSFRPITPSDTVNIRGGIARSIYVGSIAGGSVIVAVNENDVAVTFTGLVAGQILPIVTKRINASSTTASNLVAL